MYASKSHFEIGHRSQMRLREILGTALDEGRFYLLRRCSLSKRTKYVRFCLSRNDNGRRKASNKVAMSTNHLVSGKCSVRDLRQASNSHVHRIDRQGRKVGAMRSDDVQGLAEKAGPKRLTLRSEAICRLYIGICRAHWRDYCPALKRNVLPIRG